MDLFRFFFKLFVSLKAADLLRIFFPFFFSIFSLKAVDLLHEKKLVDIQDEKKKHVQNPDGMHLFISKNFNSSKLLIFQNPLVLHWVRPLVTVDTA